MSELCRDRDELMLKALATGDSSEIGDPRDRDETFFKTISDKVGDLTTKIANISIDIQDILSPIYDCRFLISGYLSMTVEYVDETGTHQMSTYKFLQDKSLVSRIEEIGWGSAPSTTRYQVMSVDHRGTYPIFTVLVTHSTTFEIEEWTMTADQANRVNRSVKRYEGYGPESE